MILWFDQIRRGYANRRICSVHDDKLEGISIGLELKGHEQSLLRPD